MSLITDLADRPMRGSLLLYDCVPLSWHLSDGAFSEKDCVAACLSEALGQSPEFCEQGLSKAAKMLGEKCEGFTRASVFAFLRAGSFATVSASVSSPNGASGEGLLAKLAGFGVGKVKRVDRLVLVVQVG